MRFLFLSLIVMLAALPARAASSYEITAAKAARFFEAREWASAQALYGVMLDERPETDSTYVNAIISASMLGDSIGASDLLTRAMNAGISFSQLMNGVKQVSFRISEPTVYEDFLLLSQRDCPWLERAIDSELLGYHIFRDNGTMIIRYAQKMLTGLPDSIDYLSALASGYTHLGDFDNAVATWKRILELSPCNYDTLLKLGNYYYLTGCDNEAADYLTKAQSIHATPFVASRLSALDGDKKKH